MKLGKYILTLGRSSSNTEFIPYSYYGIYSVQARNSFHGTEVRNEFRVTGLRNEFRVTGLRNEFRVTGLRNKFRGTEVRIKFRGTGIKMKSQLKPPLAQLDYPRKNHCHQYSQYPRIALSYPHI